jgi:Zn-dependent peptidase ImmA (M78 family)/DNA-binding XRE family transcriptional regulator
MASNKARVKKELLTWGRQMSGMPATIAAKKIGVSEDRLKEWEEGKSAPTIRQLRDIANTYKQSFAAFFLEEPPLVPKLPLKDYRRLPGSTTHAISHEIVMDVRTAQDRRTITLELMALNDVEPRRFDYTANTKENAEALARRIRSDLGVTLEQQKKLRDPRKGFNFWRETLEQHNILVFQSSTIGTAEMRGYSIFEEFLPIIVVNRKDAEAARIFTMLHELVHLYLRASGLCDLEPRTDIPPEEQRLEQYCNEVAAGILVPKEHFLKHKILVNNADGEWTDDEIAALARDFCVSREMIARRLVETNRATKVFYRDKRDQYLAEWEAKKSTKGSGFVPPATDVISKGGHVLPELVIRSLKSRKIDSTSASELLGVKLKHLPKIGQSLGY